jgi:serine/threonine-protein kinase RsbW
MTSHSPDTGSLPEQWHEESVRSNTEATLIGDRVAAQMTGAGFTDKELFAVRLSLEEAIVNGIRHGNCNDPSKTVRVRYQVSSDQVLAEIEDQGPGFDPGKVPDPLAPENIENPSGRGIFLIRHYMTWVKFNDRGNCIIICKQRGA